MNVQIKKILTTTEKLKKKNYQLSKDCQGAKSKEWLIRSFLLKRVSSSLFSSTFLLDLITKKRN